MRTEWPTFRNAKWRGSRKSPRPPVAMPCCSVEFYSVQIWDEHVNGLCARRRFRYRYVVDSNMLGRFSLFLVPSAPGTFHATVSQMDFDEPNS